MKGNSCFFFFFATVATRQVSLGGVSVQLDQCHFEKSTIASSCFLGVSEISPISSIGKYSVVPTSPKKPPERVATPPTLGAAFHGARSMAHDCRTVDLQQVYQNMKVRFKNLQPATHSSP